MRSRHISEVIAADPGTVHAFAAAPDNLPHWAAGLAQSQVRREGDELVVDSPMGEVRVRFVPHNEFGVLDHDVRLPDGTTVTNPMRVLAHPDGAEVVFSVRQLAMDDAEFDRDCEMVAADLQRLRQLLEDR